MVSKITKQGDAPPGSSCDPELPIGEGCRSPVAYRLNSSRSRRRLGRLRGPGEEPRRGLLVSREAGGASEEGGSPRRLDQIDPHHLFSLCRHAPVRATVGP
jgi:hypothetical protein